MLQPIFLLITQRGIQMVKIIQNIMSDLVVRMDQASTPCKNINVYYFSGLGLSNRWAYQQLNNWY